jgi:hypothetical protein
VEEIFFTILSGVCQLTSEEPCFISLRLLK